MTDNFDIIKDFLTPKESGELCLASSILGRNMETFFPMLSDNLKLTKFSDIAICFLKSHGFDEVICESEEEARARVDELLPQKKWPVYFFDSDTTGEKDFEEFFTDTEELDMCRFSSIGVIKNNNHFDSIKLEDFEKSIYEFISEGCYNREMLIQLFNRTIRNFNHKETGKFLDNRM